MYSKTNFQIPVTGRFLATSTFQTSRSKTNKLKVAAYIRVSTDSSDQENSYETQERYFHTLIDNNEDWTMVGIYSDYGISGTSSKKRTGFQRMIRHCTEGRIDHIICKSISRFARNTTDFITTLRVLHENQVTIFFDRENINTANSINDFILVTLGAIAQEESRNISCNINLSNKMRFQRGDVRNQDIYGYRYNDEIVTAESGFQYKDIEIVEQEEKIVRRIFSEVAEGNNFADIAKRLNFDKIPSPEGVFTQRRRQKAKKGQLYSHLENGWTAEHISQIIHNERYVGDVLIQKTFTQDYLTHRTVPNKGEVEQFYVTSHHAAIVERTLYEEVQCINKINSKLYNRGNGKRTIYAFCGRLICGQCGRFFHIRNTNKYPIWFCPSTTLRNGKVICHADKVYEEQIIRVFRKAILTRFHLVVQPIQDNVEVDDIMSGRFHEATDEFIKPTSFVSQMCARLERIQNTDFMERDQIFYRRKLSELQNSIAEQQKTQNFLIREKESIEKNYFFTEDTSIQISMVEEKEKKIKMLQANIEREQSEMKSLSKQFDYMEQYWMELENNFVHRKHAIEWMKKLPEGKEGIIAFLNGITSDYCRAFVFSVTIFDPLNYVVHWFDDTKTRVKMNSNIEDYRYTTSYLNKK